jgi:hypothetical protein
MLDKSAEYVGVFTTSATPVRLWPNFWCRKEIFAEVLITEFHEYVSRLSPDFTWKKANRNNVETKVWGFEVVSFECSQNNYKNMCLRVAYCWQRETAPVILTVQRPPSYQVANLLYKYKLYQFRTSFYINNLTLPAATCSALQITAELDSSFHSMSLVHTPSPVLNPVCV